MPPRKILNTALRDARWLEDEPPTHFVDIGNGPFVPVLAMPSEERSLYELDNYSEDDVDLWDQPCPLSNFGGTAAGDIWSR